MNNLDNPEEFEDDHAEWELAALTFIVLCFCIALFILIYDMGPYWGGFFSG